MGFKVGGPFTHAQYEQRVLVSKGPRVGRVQEARHGHPTGSATCPSTPRGCGWRLPRKDSPSGGAPGLTGPSSPSEFSAQETGMLRVWCTECCSSPGPQTPAWYPAWCPLIRDPISAHPGPLPRSPLCSHLDSDATALPHVGCLAVPFLRAFEFRRVVPSCERSIPDHLGSPEAPGH